eukprot:g4876.t1
MGMRTTKATRLPSAVEDTCSQVYRVLMLKGGAEDSKYGRQYSKMNAGVHNMHDSNGFDLTLDWITTICHAITLFCPPEYLGCLYIILSLLSLTGDGVEVYITIEKIMLYPTVKQLAESNCFDKLDGGLQHDAAKNLEVSIDACVIMGIVEVGASFFSFLLNGKVAGKMLENSDSGSEKGKMNKCLAFSAQVLGLVLRNLEYYGSSYESLITVDLVTQNITPSMLCWIPKNRTLECLENTGGLISVSGDASIFTMVSMAKMMFCVFAVTLLLK